MPNREDVLREKTFKGDDTQRRVFNTLCDGMPSQVGTATARDLEAWLHKTSKAVALLVAHLERTGKLTPNELDDLLIEVVH